VYTLGDLRILRRTVITTSSVSEHAEENILPTRRYYMGKVYTVPFIIPVIQYLLNSRLDARQFGYLLL